MELLLKNIQQELKDNASAAVAASQKKFVPGKTKMYGVPMPVLNDLSKKYKDGGFQIVEALWHAGVVEEHILAAKILGKIAAKDAVKTLQLIEKYSAEINNWAECDALGMQGIKPLVKKHAKEIFALAKKLNHSANLWQRRLSLVLVEWYTRDEQYHPAINKLVSALEDDPEYYVRKAVVWIKRNFTKGR